MEPFSKSRKCYTNASALLDNKSQYWLVKSEFGVNRAGEFMFSEEVVDCILHVSSVTFLSMK